MTLYELTDNYMQLLMMAEDPDVDPETLADTMAAIDGEIEDKADGFARVMKELEARETAMKTEVDRLNAHRLTIANNIKCMKLSLQTAMQATGKTRFKTALFSFGIQKNPPAVVLDVAETELPEEYLIPQPPKVNKTKIKDDLKAGKTVEGARLEQSEGLRIR